MTTAAGSRGAQQTDSKNSDHKSTLSQPSQRRPTLPHTSPPRPALSNPRWEAVDGVINHSVVEVVWEGVELTAAWSQS